MNEINCNQPLACNNNTGAKGSKNLGADAEARNNTPTERVRTNASAQETEVMRNTHQTAEKNAERPATSAYSQHNSEHKGGNSSQAQENQNEQAKSSSKVTAIALVSSTNDMQAGETLVAKVLLAGQLTLAHLDSCATHCFVNHDTSENLRKRGFPPVESPVEFDVRQGNPLCCTNLVHYLPLSIITEDRSIGTWNNCLFIVADAGAPVIICYAALRLGGIIRYVPPPGYEQLLVEYAPKESSSAPEGMSAAEMLEQPYHAPLHTVVALHTTARDESSVLENSTGNFAPTLPTPNYSDPLLVPLSSITSTPEENRDVTAITGDGLPEPQSQSQTLTGKHCHTSEVLHTMSATKKRKGETDMLSEENPYGKNPPLPEEVMEAVRHLKLLSDPSTTPTYSPSQEEELKSRLGKQRPRWANCLTLQQTMEVADLEAAQFINDLMDKPVYQKSIFADSLKQCCDLREYEIPQKPGRDTWTPAQPRRYKNPTMAKVVDAWLDGLLENEKCRESLATHPAPITVVEKAGRDPRVCIDYRNRNARSEVPVFPMPDVHEFLDDNAGFNYYCSFDMRAMFNQFRLKEEHKHLAAFITNRGVYEPNVIMFGLQGGPQHAVRECGGAMAMDPLTNGKTFTEWATQQNSLGVQPPYEICPTTRVVKGSRLRPFIDDVTVPSNHLEGMKKLVELFFEFCKKHNLILSRKKAQIMKRYLRMLGFVVSRQGKHLDPHRIIALLEAKRPQSKETLHSLLSSFTFVRMFIPNFASIAAPLHEATRGIIWKGPQSGRSKGIREVDPDFLWTPEMIRAYDQLRNALLEAPILVAVNWDYPLFLSVDASIRGEGWVLWQLLPLSDGTKVAVAILYGSRKYNDSEKNWETTRQEASAIRSALEDVYDYVFGQHFYLFSDHLNLRFMQNSVNRAVIRMRDFLAQFNMTVIHCPGIWNNADPISRLETESLPTELAQSLLSAEEARLEGNRTIVSVGTFTEEDPFTPGDDKLQPMGRNTSDSPVEGSACARVLCTSVNVAGNRCLCFLCHLNDDFEDETYSDSDCVEVASVMQTEVQPTVVEKTDITMWQRVTEKLFQSDFETLITEAADWNKRIATNPRSPLTPFPNPMEDLEDIEELSWCGKIVREAVVLKSASAPRYKSKNHQPTTQTPNTILKTAHKPRTKGKRVTFKAQEVTKEATSPSTEPMKPAMVELKDANTQSTPADFRMAKIYFPLKEDFLAIHNNDSGHHGLDHSYRKLLKRCGSQWANERGAATKIKASLKDFIDACPICQKVRGLKEKIKNKHSFIVSRPFLEVSTDFIVFKREDRNGNRYILVTIDNFTKLVEMKATPHRDAETVARFLMELQSRYGPMARLRSDKDGAFTGLLIQRLNQARGTESSPCIPYHPQANSICERQNAIIMNHLNALILGCALGPDSKVGWSDLLPKVFAIVNNTPKNPLGISPLSLIYGVFANYDQPLIPEAQANPPGSTSNPIDYLDALTAWQSKLLDISEDIQSEHFKKLSNKTNSHEKIREFHVGDFVLQERSATGLSGKPCTRWTGPFLVLERRENDPSHPVLDLMNLTDMKVKEASINDCRQFNTSWFNEDTLQRELVKLAALDDNEYVVERIVSHQPQGETRTKPLSKYLFEVKWQDFEDTTWEPYSSLKDLEPMDQYAKLHPGLGLGRR